MGVCEHVKKRKEEESEPDCVTAYMSSVYAERAGSELSEDAEISRWSFRGYKHLKRFVCFGFD